MEECMPIRYFEVMELEQISAVVRAAHQSGVIASLGKTPVSANALAERTGGDPRAYQFLMDVLENLGYASASDGGYVASRELGELRKDQSFNWDHLPQFLSSGKPWKEIDKTLDDLSDFYVNFFGDMEYADQMLPVAKAVAERLGSHPTRILDIGAGTGVWSLAMAAMNTGSSVMAVDLEGVLVHHFQRRAAQLGLAGRAATRTGDFHCLEYPKEAYDRVVMGQSYHFLRKAESGQFLGNVAAALVPGGEFMAIHHFADSTAHQRLSRSLYNMRLAMRSKGTKNYSRDEMEEMCGQAGLRLKDSFEVEGPSFLSVMVFQKPATAAPWSVASRDSHQ
jgi:ubiquinone/menaquinone biosynthesis C-methylase UbiE